MISAKSLYLLFFSALSIVGSSGRLGAAELGRQFKTYDDMHTKTQFGALLLATGVSRAVPPFTEIVGTADVPLPPQQVYCFVLNHYIVESPHQYQLRFYYAKITKWDVSGSSTTENFQSAFVPTTDRFSKRVVDLCIDGIGDKERVSIDFSSTAGSPFRHSIHFRVQK